MKEIWKSIKGYNRIYKVSNLGRIKNTRTNYLLKPIDSHGYKYVHLCDENHKRKNKPIHRLVAQAFLPNKNLPEVNHKDGDKSNNSVDNLEWCTSKENAIHKAKILRKNCKRVRCIETGEIFESIQEAANHYKLSQNCLVAVLKQYKYQHTFAGYHWEYMI